MSHKIIVGNLPPNVTVEALTEVLAESGVEEPQVALNNEGDPEKVAAVLDLGDLDRAAADRIAQKINGSLYEGRTLSAFVPLFS